MCSMTNASWRDILDIVEKTIKEMERDADVRCKFKCFHKPAGTAV